MTTAWIVFRKELRETLRDRRTLLMMVVVPVLLYPALLVATEQLALVGFRQLEAEPATVGVAGSGSVNILRFLERRDGVTVVDVLDPVVAIRADSVQAVVVLGPRPIAGSTQSATVLYDATDERSLRARNVLTESLRDWGEGLLAERLTERGLPLSFATPLALADSSVARAEELGGYTLGRFLPMLLILVTLLGTFYPAIDLAAGEKERGTLETLLTAPVPASQIVFGKFLTVALIGVVAAALNLTSMLLTFQTGLFQLGATLDIEFTLPLEAVLIIFVTLIPLSVLFASLFLGIAVRSRSFKEAQTALTPLYLAVMIPALLPAFPGIDFTVALAAVPVAGVGLFFRELMSGSPAVVPSAIAVITTGFWAAAALAFASKSFGREQVLFGEGDARVRAPGNAWRRFRGLAGPSGATPQVGQAVGLIVVVGALFFYGGFPLQARLGQSGLFLSEWLFLFLPVLVLIWWAGLNLNETLSLSRPRPRHVLAALLLITGGAPVGWFLAWVQGFVLPIPWELLEGLDELITAESPSQFLWLIALFALTPAICEEVVFRGVFLAGTRGRASALRIVVLNAVVFGVFHVSFESVFRFLPTAWLGFLLAWSVMSTGSIWVGVLMHFVNNGSIVLIASVPDLRAWFETAGDGPPWILLPPAVLAIVLGFHLMPPLRVGREKSGTQSR